MPQGSRGHVGIKKETTWGTRASTGVNDFFLPFVTESLTTDIEEVLSAAQKGILDESASYQGERAFAGDVVIEVHPTSFGHILRSALDIPAAATPAGTAELEIENCNDAWNEVVDEGVYSSIDVGDKKKGTASAKITVTDSVTTGDILVTEVIGSNDMTEATHIKLWVKHDIGCSSGDMQFLLDDSTGCSSPTQLLNMDTYAADVWKESTLAIPESSGLGAIISLGLKYVTDVGECIIHLDDVRKITETDASSGRQHVFTPMQTAAEEFHADCPLRPYTLEVYRDEGQAFQYLGAVVNAFTLSFSTTDKILKATCGIIAKNAGYIDATALSVEATDPFVWENAVVKIGGTSSGDINNDLESFSMTFDNMCVAKYALNNTTIPRKIIRDGVRTIPISFVIDFVDKAEYTHFLDGDEQHFQVKFEGVDCEAGYPYTLQIDMPQVRYTAYPINIGGQGRLSASVTGKAKYSSTGGGYAVQMTLINLKDTVEYSS